MASKRISIVGYHSIDLGQGIVTQGMFDHRPILHKYCLPERLQGMRVLDVAIWDGFWAYPPGSTASKH